MKTKMNNNACAAFGEFVKAVRLKNEITAREAAEDSGILPSNFSKMEHGLLAPPQNGAKQRKIATAIGLAVGSEEEARFFDLAGFAVGATPVDVSEIISREEALPLLLRTIGNKRLGTNEIERLVSIVRGTGEPIKKT